MKLRLGASFFAVVVKLYFSWKQKSVADRTRLDNMS